MHSLRSSLIAGTFVLVLGGGAVAQLFHVDNTTSLNENRNKAAFPRFGVAGRTIPNYARDVDRWFSDHFEFRNALIRANSRLRNRGLHSPSSPAVVFGADGWLYYTSDSSLWFARRANPFSTGELDRVAGALEERTRSLATRGIRYLLMVAPDPSTIYPEYQPPWLRKAAPGPARIDQLMTIAAGRKTFAVVDPRAALFAAKGAAPALLYRPTDTHWNDRGAYLGYRALMDGLARVTGGSAATDIGVPLPLDSLSAARVDTTGGDLAVMLGLGDSYHEQLEMLSPRHSSLSNPIPADRLTPDFTTAWRDTATGPRVLVFRDSYFSAMLPFFAESFARVRYVMGPYREDIVAEEKPDIVVEEMVERYLTVARFAGPH